MKTKYMVLCGGEGSGKSTLLQHARALYPGLFFTREPGGSPYAENIRKTIFHGELGANSNPETQFLLMWAARTATMHEWIVPAIARNQHVLSDRGDCCTYAYQIVAGKRPDLAGLFWDLRSRFLRPSPDMYIFFDVDVERGLARAKSRQGEGNHFDDLTASFHLNVQSGYRDFLKYVPHRVVDANQSLDTVKGQFVKILDEMLQ